MGYLKPGFVSYRGFNYSINRLIQVPNLSASITTEMLVLLGVTLEKGGVVGNAYL